MAISPPSDIVLDVSRAADPVKYREAAERLARLSGAGKAVADAPASWATSTAAAPASASVEPSLAADMPGQMPSPGSAATVRNRRRLDAFGQFEAFVLQSFIQSMLPQKAAMVYGKGTAGEVWKSMLAEKLGTELAQSGQIGIANRLASGPDHSAIRTSDGGNGLRPPASLASTLPYIVQRVDTAGEPSATPAVDSPDPAERS